MQLKTCKYTCKHYLKYVRVKKKASAFYFLYQNIR